MKVFLRTMTDIACRPVQMWHALILPVVPFVLLLLMACDGGRRTEMEARLERADSLNRAYVPMTDGLDSLLREAVQWYDRHGTANEQVRAHYLLGCAYRDLQQAPQALESYQDALDRADTLASDCDYRRLMSVYGQMAELFHAQNLPKEELAATRGALNAAQLQKDTLAYVRCLELLFKPYFMSGDTAKAIEVILQAKAMCKERGEMEQAVSSNVFLASLSLEKNNLAEAERYFNEYEQTLALYGDSGKIHPSRVHYYYVKGKLLLYENKVQQAEHSFRQIVNYPEEQVDAYRGLLAVYQIRGDKDSIAKYAGLYEKALDEANAHLQTETVARMSALFRYHHFQREMQKAEQKAERFRFLLMGMVVLAIVLLYILYRYWKYQQGRRQALLSEYQRICSDYAKAIDDLVLVKSNAQEFEEAKEREIALLHSRLHDYDEKLRSVNIHVSERFLDSDIVALFHEKARPKPNYKLPTASEWHALKGQFRDKMPFASVVIGHDASITDKEYKACMLLMLSFSNDELALLLDTSLQNLSNIKSRANQKLFGESTSVTLAANLRRKYEENLFHLKNA